mgnify:CR=1 FL=1|tara:strand:+ start:226 stop:1494 length:1269 start_codon:yes stop_codon:yes gene_type:complete
MASTFKMFLNDDIVTSRTLLHEAIPITGSIIYGTYGVFGAETHVKTYAHGMFTSIYDYPYLSSSANHIFDMTFGHHSDYKLKGVTGTDSNTDGSFDGVTDLANIESRTFYKKRKNIYSQMAQILVGHDVSGNIQKFDVDGDLVGSTTDKYNGLIFFNFARLLGKDEIKKGSFEIQVGVVPEYGPANDQPNQDITLGQAATMQAAFLTIKDDGAATDYRVNSPAGEYGILKVTADTTHSGGGAYENNAEYDRRCGLIYYQAGIVALSPDVFMQFHASNYKKGKISDQSTANMVGNGNEQGVEMVDSLSILQMLGGGVDYTMDQMSAAIRQRIKKICFNNTTELNSTIYFCRVNHNDFNYSSNPTYLENSKIRVKRTLLDAPVSYITTVGLYSADNELLAVAKVSEPLRKDPTNDMTLRVRLDY